MDVLKEMGEEKKQEKDDEGERKRGEGEKGGEEKN